MSEKRFTEHHLLECQMIFDNVTERGYYFNGEQVDIDDVKYLVDLLNEQSETIEHLEEECGARENDYVLLQRINSENIDNIQKLSQHIKKLENELDKIPENIKEVWK